MIEYIVRYTEQFEVDAESVEDAINKTALLKAPEREIEVYNTETEEIVEY